MRAGETIGGRFELREVLGEGGMGQVFRAWDTELERYVAIKAMLPQFMSDPAALDEMKQEVRLSQRLSHPAIVSVYDYRVHERTPYIIMEFIDGLPLHHFIFRQPTHRLDERTFLAFADQILVGVAYAHERGVVHRDLKPANIMVLVSGQLKLMDFGIAAAIKATYTRVTGRSSGLTIQYSSPEQINGENPSPSMDIYSLGCVFYEMLCGHPPFYQGEVLHQQLTRQPAPLAGVSPAINAAVLGCLVKDPSKRFRSAAEVRLSLAGDRTIRLPRSRSPASPWLDGREGAAADAPTVPSSLVTGEPVRAGAGPWRQGPAPFLLRQLTAWSGRALAPALLASGVALVFVGGSLAVFLPPPTATTAAPAAAPVTPSPPAEVEPRHATEPEVAARSAPPSVQAPALPRAAVPSPPARAIDPKTAAPDEDAAPRPPAVSRVPSLDDEEGYDYLSMRDAASRGAPGLTLNAFLTGQAKVADDRARRERWRALGAEAAQQLVRSVRRSTTDPDEIADACRVARQLDARVASRECGNRQQREP